MNTRITNAKPLALITGLETLTHFLDVKNDKNYSMFKKIRKGKSDDDDDAY